MTCFFAEEDIKLNNQTFNWPGRMDPIFEVGQQRLASRREKAENVIKDRHVTAGEGRGDNDSMVTLLLSNAGRQSLKLCWKSTKLR